MSKVKGQGNGLLGTVKLGDEYSHGKKRPDIKRGRYTMDELEDMANQATKQRMTYGQLQQLETLGEWRYHKTK